MPQEVINKVHHIATKQKAPDGIAFTRIDGILYFQAEDDDPTNSHDDDKIDDHNGDENTNVEEAAENAEVGLDVENAEVNEVTNGHLDEHEEMDESDDKVDIPIDQMDEALDPEEEH